MGWKEKIKSLTGQAKEKYAEYREEREVEHELSSARKRFEGEREQEFKREERETELAARHEGRLQAAKERGLKRGREGGFFQRLMKTTERIKTTTPTRRRQPSRRRPSRKRYYEPRRYAPRRAEPKPKPRSKLDEFFGGQTKRSTRKQRPFKFL